MSPEFIVLALGAALILDVRTSRVVVAYVILAAWVAALALPSALGSPVTLALFVLSFGMKLVVAPLGIWFFTQRNPAARDLRPAINLPLRLVLVLALAFVSQGVTPLRLVDLATYLVLCGLTVLIVQRNLLAALIGLLVLGLGATLTGVALAPQLPASIELGAAFDALIVTFIGLGLVRAFLAHDATLDVSSLRRLRG